MDLISVIIPMRNAEAFVAQTLKSILSQDDVRLEIVVVNDGSVDGSAEVVRGLNDSRIRMIDGPQRGISAAFNAGLAEARGAQLCRCDADDLYPPKRLSRQAAFLRDHPEYGAVCSGYSFIGPTGQPVRTFAEGTAVEDVTPELLAGGGRSHMSAFLFRTDLVRQIDGCREWFVTSEDADLQFRLAQATRIAFLPIDAYHYRLHDNSITHSQADERRKFYERCAGEFLKQRLAGGLDDLQRGNPPQAPAAAASARSTGRQIRGMLWGDAWRLHAAGQKRAALAKAAAAWKIAPLSPTSWTTWIKLFLKPSGRTAPMNKAERMHS